jgi:hypothetical protein
MRGVALPETVIVLMATLALVFGVIQFGIIGFLQIMVDGAAFVAAHEYALLNTTTYDATTTRIFPQVLSTPSPTANSSDDTSVPVNYNTSLSTARQGGVSLIRRNHLQMSVTRNAPSGLLGVGVAGLSGVTVQGSAIEPNTQVGNDVYDVNAAGYSGSGGTPMNYYSDAQNGPANYINLEIMSYCETGTTTTTTGSGNAAVTKTTLTPFGSTCPSNDRYLRTLGTAEFLDHDNWQRTNIGVGLYSGGSGYTFAEMLCHQFWFANAAQVFKPATSESNMPNVTRTNTAALVVIYGWDYVVNSGGGESLSENNFDQYPLNPASGCP